MSSSQEAANAERMLREDVTKTNDRRAKAIAALTKNSIALKDLEQKRPALVQELADAEREAGRAEATLAAFVGPKGYGGAPGLNTYGQLADYERRELENYRSVERTMMGPGYKPPRPPTGGIPPSGIARTLPTFQGYTVDERLREFRMVVPDKGVEFVRFDSPKGLSLLASYRALGSRRR